MRWGAAAAIIAEPARNVADLLLKCEAVTDLRSWKDDFDRGVRDKLKSEGLTEDATSLVVAAELLALAQGRVSEPWLNDETGGETLTKNMTRVSGPRCSGSKGGNHDGSPLHRQDGSSVADLLVNEATVGGELLVVAPAVVDWGVTAGAVSQAAAPSSVVVVTPAAAVPSTMSAFGQGWTGRNQGSAGQKRTD